MVDPVPDTNSRAQLLAEARLLVSWALGAAGPWLPAETAIPDAWQDPVPAPAKGPAAVAGGPVTSGPRSSPSRPAARSASPAVTTLETGPVTTLEPVTPEECKTGMAQMAEEVSSCTRCVLAGTRQQTVFGEGSLGARLVIVGEAPGAEEDRTGRPFVGAAGQLLTKMLEAIGLAREDVYICNLLKCRPPGNRNPRPDEVGRCKPFLKEQLRLIQPEVVLALGAPAARELLQTHRGITSLRGRYMKTQEGHRVMPTFHPAYLLRNPAAKREVWADLQRVAATLGLEIPKRR